MHHQAHRHRVGLRVDEAAPAHAIGAAQELLRGPLPAGQTEAGVDLVFAQQEERPHTEGEVLRFESVMETRLLGQQRQRAVCRDDEGSLDEVVPAVDPHAPHFAVRLDQAVGPAAGEQSDAPRHRLVGIPAVEQRPVAA